MPENYKIIHIGEMIRVRMQECEVSSERAVAFLRIPEEEIVHTYTRKSVDADILLRWSKLLKYDFFRVYSQHLILYAPQEAGNPKRKKKNKTQLPVFKKNIYTQEVILYLVGLIESGKKTYKQIQEEYNIPSTTILRWYDKYGKKQ